MQLHTTSNALTLTVIFNFTGATKWCGVIIFGVYPTSDIAEINNINYLIFDIYFVLNKI